MSTTQENFLRPSLLGRLDLCIHHRPDGKAGDSLFVRRGSRIDELVQKVINGEPVGTWTIAETADVAAAEWTGTQAKELLENIQCQKKLQLLDLFVVPNELIMEGTCDIIGWNKEDKLLEIWDVKSGRERDYSAQLMAYALMAMDQTGQEQARIRVAYCDDKLFQESIVSRSQCEHRIFGIIERVRLGTEPPTENEYCSQCALQLTCEVWTKATDLALAIVDTRLIEMAPALDPALTPQSRLELIKADPILLGYFIDCWRKASILVEKLGLEDHAKELLLANPDAVPGWRVQENQGRSFFNKEQIQEILKAFGEDAADFLAINRERYETACANSDNEIMEPEGRSKSFFKLLRQKK